jgi:two-component system phosphate regulon sensor histidine kinase PhoR
MKIQKPSTLVLIGSIVIGALCYLIQFLANINQATSHTTWILVSLLVSLLTYFIFGYFFKNFILNRLNLIVKNVYSTSKEKSLNQLNNSADDLLEDMELEIQNWENEKSKEIDKLKEQEAFRREFLGNLSHELKTPLFTVQGYLLTLLDGAMDDKNIRKKYLQRAEKGVERLVYIVNDLDMITKLELDTLGIETSKFNIVYSYNFLTSYEDAKKTLSL